MSRLTSASSEDPEDSRPPTPGPFLDGDRYASTNRLPSGGSSSSIAVLPRDETKAPAPPMPTTAVELET